MTPAATSTAPSPTAATPTTATPTTATPTAATGRSGIEPSLLAAALQQAAAVLGELTSGQLHDIAAGRGRLVFRPDGTAARNRPAPEPAGADVTAVVEAIGRLTAPADVADYLRRNDARFTVPILRRIARALGPTVSTTGRSKAELQRNIVEGTAGFRARSAAMSGGAWS